MKIGDTIVVEKGKRVFCLHSESHVQTHGGKVYTYFSVDYVKTGKFFDLNRLPKQFLLESESFGAPTEIMSCRKVLLEYDITGAYIENKRKTL